MDSVRVSGRGRYPLGGERGGRTGKQTAESIMMSMSSNAGGGGGERCIDTPQNVGYVLNDSLEWPIYSMNLGTSADHIAYSTAQ